MTTWVSLLRCLRFMALMTFFLLCCSCCELRKQQMKQHRSWRFDFFCYYLLGRVVVQLKNFRQWDYVLFVLLFTCRVPTGWQRYFLALLCPCFSQHACLLWNIAIHPTRLRLWGLFVFCFAAITARAQHMSA